MASCGALNRAIYLAGCLRESVLGNAREEGHWIGCVGSKEEGKALVEHVASLERPSYWQLGRAESKEELVDL